MLEKVNVIGMDRIIRKMVDPYVKTLRNVERWKNDSNLTEQRLKSSGIF